MEIQWPNILEAIVDDNVEKLTSFVPSQISFNSTIPLDIGRIELLLMNETHSLLTFSSKVNATKCAMFLAGGGSDVNYKTNFSLTAYLYAVQNNNIELVNYFINFQGIDLNVFNTQGYYPLHIATSKGYDQLVSIFLAQINIINSSKTTNQRITTCTC